MSNLIKNTVQNFYGAANEGFDFNSGDCDPSGAAIDTIIGSLIKFPDWVEVGSLEIGGNTELYDQIPNRFKCDYNLFKNGVLKQFSAHPADLDAKRREAWQADLDDMKKNAKLVKAGSRVECNSFMLKLPGQPYNVRIFNDRVVWIAENPEFVDMCKWFTNTLLVD